MYINELKTSLIRHIKHFNNEFFVINFFHIMYAPLSSLCDVNIIPCFSTIMELSRSISTIMEIYDTMQFGKGVVSPLNYKEAIVEIVGKIHSERILKRIYKFVLYLYTHETGS